MNLIVLLHYFGSATWLWEEQKWNFLNNVYNFIHYFIVALQLPVCIDNSSCCINMINCLDEKPTYYNVSLLLTLYYNRQMANFFKKLAETPVTENFSSHCLQCIYSNMYKITHIISSVKFKHLLWISKVYSSTILQSMIQIYFYFLDKFINKCSIGNNAIKFYVLDLFNYIINLLFYESYDYKYLMYDQTYFNEWFIYKFLCEV